jgi:gluconolactonase
LYRISLAGQVETFASTGGFCLGMAFDADGNLYVCDIGHQAVMRVTPAGAVDTYCADCEGEHLKSPNYPVFDAQGNLYVSDSGDHFHANGKVIKIRPGGQAEVFSREPHVFSNGMALAPDDRKLYVVESEIPAISALPILADGRAGPCELAVRLPDDDVPDGITFDDQNNLYISCYQPNRIYRWSPAGQLEILVDDPTGLHLALAPTNVAFGGPDRDILFVANLGGWHVAQGRIGARGAPLHYPKL